MSRGGARPGAGRKKGQVDNLGPNKSEVKNVSLKRWQWERLDKEAELRGITRSAVIAEKLNPFFAE